MALTATQNNNEAKICWQSPFDYFRSNNRIQLSWSNDPSAVGSTDSAMYSRNQTADITN